MLSLSDIVNVKVGIGRGVFEAPGATVIGGKKPSFNLEILKLFANGEQGFWYDPNDIGTMFQDAVGIVPVAGIGQPVGLVFDKRKGLEATPVLSQQITFSFVPAGTTPPTTNSNNSYLGKPCVSVTFPQVSSGGYAVSRAVGAPHAVMSGKFYKWYYKIALSRKLVAGEAIVVYVTGAQGASAVTINSSTQDNVWIAGQSTSMMNIQGTMMLAVYALALGSPATVFATDFSANTLDIGNHAFQSTSAARPILQDTPRRIDFDAVDDKLITNLPTQLTGCTVIRSVPGVGVQLLTNQTIPATYEDNKDHCGLIVINRALTPSETSAITAEFNKRAGV